MAGPNPTLSSLGAGWETAGRRGGRGASDRSWLMEGLSPSVVLVPAQCKSRRVANKLFSHVMKFGGSPYV